MKPFDRTGNFRGIDQGVKLSRLAIRNAGVTIFAQAGVFLIQLAGTIVLARILQPEAFGLVTMVTTFSLLLSSFGLNGFTEAILQRKEINHLLASNLLWINIAGGLILSAVFAASGSLLARFYGDSRIRGIAIAFSLTIFFSVAPIVHLSLLKRAMRFKAVSINDIVGRMGYVVVAIYCVHLNWGYWALVAGSIAQSLLICLGALTLCLWLPGLPRRVDGTWEVVQYAANVYTRFGLNYGSRNTDNLLVGWRFGAPSLGLYKKAYDLFVLPSNQLLSPVVAVAVATLSRLNSNREEYKRTFRKALWIVALVGMGVSADLTLIGRELVRVILGPQWGEAGRIFTYFAPGIGLMLLYQMNGWIHLSVGTPRRWLRWTVIEFVVTVMLFLLALRWGPAEVAGAWTLSFCLLMVPAFWYAGQSMDLGPGTLIRAIWRYIAAAAVAGFLCSTLFSTHLINFRVNENEFLTAAGAMVMKSAVFALLYLGGIVILHGGTQPLQELRALLPDLLPGSRRLLPKTSSV